MLSRWTWLASLGVLLGMTTSLEVYADCASEALSPARLRGLGDAAPPPDGERVRIGGTVSARLPGVDGFYVQATAPDGDAAGVFVYTPKRDASALPPTGAQVRIVGQAGRYRGRVQLERVTRITRCGRRTPKAVPLALPAPAQRLRRLEDTLVRVASGLVVTGNDALARYGSLRLSAGERLRRSKGGQAVKVRLDDGAYRRDPRPVPYLNAAGTRRAGSELGAFSAVLDHAFGDWRVHPTEAVDFRESNPRAPPPALGPGIRVVSWNLKNFYAVTERRGPSTAAGRQRQRNGIAAAINALDADVLVLQEIENRAGAMRALLQALRAADPQSDYRAAVPGQAPFGAIRVAVLYRSAGLNLENAVFLDRRVHDRPPLAVVLSDSHGQRLGIIAVHFKSKGGCSAASKRASPAGCWGIRRQRQADSLLRWLASLRARTELHAWLVAGDFNSYRGEAPLSSLQNAGLVDVVSRHAPPGQRYTYVWQGMAGALDHALATRSLAVAHAAVWHAQADEPRGAIASGPWGVSDHDPLIVDLLPLIRSSAARQP